MHNCSSPDPHKRRNFEQPIWQTAQMFVGEAGCWLVVLGSTVYQRLVGTKWSRGRYEPVRAEHTSVDGAGEEVNTGGENTQQTLAKPLEAAHPERRHLKGWRVILLALPATCDIIGTTLMNVGLLFVAASIYQMTRGALVLFVGLFSVIFLGTRLATFKWMSLFIVVAGVAIVGLAGIIENKRDRKLPGDTDPPSSLNDSLDILRATYNVARDTLEHTGSTDIDNKNTAFMTAVGILLIFLAQIFTASQFVLEESIMHRFSLTPLAVVGWEGTFGLALTLLAMLILHFAVGRTDAGRNGYFDATTGWHQMTHNPAIGVTSLLIMVSIGGFNFFGLSVTRSVSATSRSTIDTCRTLFIWVVSLGLGWESFKWLQVVGFAALVYGTFLFNEIVRPPSFRRSWMSRDRQTEQDLLPDRPQGLAES